MDMGKNRLSRTPRTRRRKDAGELRRTSSLSNLNKTNVEFLNQLDKFYRPEGMSKSEFAAYQKQENSNYDETSLLRREAIRFDLGFLDIVRRLWAAAQRQYGEAVRKEQYIAYCRKALLGVMADPVLSHRMDPGNRDMTLHDIDTLLANEWERDSQGKECLDFNLFALSWFQLADVWSVEISAGAYVAFMENIVGRICSVDVDGAFPSSPPSSRPLNVLDPRQALPCLHAHMRGWCVYS